MQELIKIVAELRLSDPEPSLLQIINSVSDIRYPTKASAGLIIEGVKKELGLIKIPAPAPVQSDLLDRITLLEQKVAKLIKQNTWHIGILGAKRNQFNELEHEFKDVEFYYLEVLQSNISIPQGLDCIVVMTDFVSHQATGQLKGYITEFVSGGVSSLKKAISEIIK